MYSILFVIICTNFVLINGITVRSCEGSTLNIKCQNANETIYIYSARYGRSSSEICPKVGAVNNTKCSSNNSVEIVRKSCQGNDSCSVNASNGVFGDPCVDTYKYLEVNYTCAPKCPMHEKLSCAPFGSFLCQPQCEFPYSPFQILIACPIIPADGNCDGKLACICNDGYVRDKKTKNCIREQYCPQPGCDCFTKEHYSECGAACQRQCGREDILAKCACEPGYVCRHGYVRDPLNNKCVKSMECSTCNH